MQTLHRIIKNSLDKKKRLPEGNLSCGDPGGARTHDPMIKSHLLYQLSHGVIFMLLAGLVSRLRVQS